MRSSSSFLRRFAALRTPRQQPQPQPQPQLQVHAISRGFATQASISEQTAQDIFRQANTIVHSEYMKKEEAEVDAESLLESTSTCTPEVLSRHIYDGEQAQSPETKLLHRAFLHLTSKSLSHSSPIAIQLAQRAHSFGLCFHLPLYKQIIVNAATHSRTPSHLILEMAAHACQSLHVALESSFFTAALRILVQRNLLRDALKVLTEMKERHDIRDLPNEFSLSLLSTLRDNLYECNEVDAADLFVALISLLDGPDPVNVDKSLMEQISDVLDQYEGDNNDDDGFGDSDNMVDSLMEMIDQGGIDLQSIVSDMQQGEDDDGQTASFAFAVKPQGYHPEFIKDAIYLRDAASWKLPDITEQMVQLNNGAELLYSQTYEEEVLEEMMKEE